MDDKVQKYVYDAFEASEKILNFTDCKVFEDFESDDLLRSAVERQFEILGEALNRINKENKAVLESIQGWREAISFRNILAHGYDIIDNLIVWAIIEKDLPTLHDCLRKLKK